MSSFEDHQGQKQKKAAKMAVRSWYTDTQPPRSRTHERGRREASMERSLANVREAHQKALATVMALEEEVEWLCCSLTKSWPEGWVQSKSRDCQAHGSRGWK